MAKPFDPFLPPEESAEDRKRNQEIADARITAGATPGKSFPAWAYIAIGVAVVAAAGVAAYFLS